MSTHRGLPIEAVTPGFVAIARPEVVSVEIDGEVILYDDSRKKLHRLNPTASALWQCLDGSGTLAEVARDIADVYHADPDQVLADVVETARLLGAQGLLVGVGDPSGEEVVGGDGDSAPLEDPGAPFVAELPRPCMDSSFTLGDAGRFTVRAGSHLLGLRASTPELADAARAVIGPSILDGTNAPPNVSLTATRARTGRPLIFCYRSGRLLARVRGTRRAVQAAIALLSSYAPRGPESLPRVAAMVAVRDGTAALLCPESWRIADRLLPRLRGAGWEVADVPWADIDPQSGEVVVSGPAFVVDDTALSRLPADPLDGSPPAPGRYPVIAWVAVTGEEPSPDTSVGRVVTLAAGAADLDAQSAPAAIQAAVAALREAIWVVSPSLDAGEVARTLANSLHRP